MISIFVIQGLLSLGVPGVPWHSQILADQLTLSEPGGHIIPTKLLRAPRIFKNVCM